MLKPGKITIGRLMLAYDLDESEIDELIKEFGAEFGISIFSCSGNNYPLTGKYSKEKADFHARKYVDHHFLKESIYPRDSDECEKDFLFLGYECYVKEGNSPINYLDAFKKAHKFWKEGFYSWEDVKISCSILLSKSFRDLSFIDKKACILYLHQQEYSVLKEMKELSKDLVERVIREEQEAVSPDNNVLKKPEFLTNPVQICDAIQTKMETVSLNQTNRRYLIALIERLKGESYKSAYLTANPSTTSDDPNTLTTQGIKYCVKGYNIAITKLEIIFDSDLFKNTPKKTKTHSDA